MHELSICKRIIDSALEVATGEVEAVKVTIGELHQIVPEYLTSAYEYLADHTRLQGSELIIHVLPVIGRCLECQWEGGITLPFFKCGHCEKYKIDILQGKELYLESLKIKES